MNPFLKQVFDDEVAIRTAMCQSMISVISNRYQVITDDPYPFEWSVLPNDDLEDDSSNIVINYNNLKTKCEIMLVGAGASMQINYCLTWLNKSNDINLRDIKVCSLSDPDYINKLLEDLEFCLKERVETHDDFRQADKGT